MRNCLSMLLISLLSVLMCQYACAADKGSADEVKKVYVPYDELQDVFEKAGQGVFLPYTEFTKLWRAAQGKPAGAAEAPFKYLMSTARLNGTVGDELASLQMELTIDILSADWVDVPIGLGDVAIAAAKFVEPADAKPAPLLRVVNGQYILTAKGAGRYVLSIDFVKQLETSPGLHVLGFKLPAAAVTTLEMVIPEENMKVDVRPMLAATTSQVNRDGKKSTRLQAFLGSASDVHLSWKPRAEAAEELDAVLICDQFQHIDVGEALIAYSVQLNYSIHRGGADAFAVSLPGGFRVTDVAGANISKWEVKAGSDGLQELTVKLFSAAKKSYSMTVKMERFLQEAGADIPLAPVVMANVLRCSGLIGITHSTRRVVHLEDVKNLARVDTGRLPEELTSRPGVTAYRFITSDYGGTISIETAKPRIGANQAWRLFIDNDRQDLFAKITYNIELTGVFQLEMGFPEPWKLSKVGPDSIVDDYELKGKGPNRTLHILLKKEQAGQFDIELEAASDRTSAVGLVDFRLPFAGGDDLQLYSAGLILFLPEQLRAETESLEQCHPVSIGSGTDATSDARRMSAAMAFKFDAVDRGSQAGAKFRIVVKPAQVSAVVDRLVKIAAAQVEQEALINYRIRYAPVDTFYVKMPASLADAGVDITGSNIKEKPRIDALPQEQQPETEAGDDTTDWAYYKIVLQSKVSGDYRLRVHSRRALGVVQQGQKADIEVAPILAAGKLSDQNGRIAVSKGDTLAIGEPVSTNLIPVDPGSATDMPYEPHRRVATLAFKYNAPPFSLVLPVVVQKEAAVFTTIVNGAIIDQVLARDGTCNTHATFVLATSQGDRLAITLPAGARLTAVLLNGNEAPVEMGMTADERIVRLPPSAGQVAKFVLEVAYGLSDVKTTKLTAPILGGKIPTQQTLWRLSIPKDYVVLGHDRAFTKVAQWESNNMIETLRQGQSEQVGFKLAGQGQVVDFVRQGAPAAFSVFVMKKEFFHIAVWLSAIVAGVALLKVCGFVRLVIVLVIGLAGGIVQLYQPLLVDHVIMAGWFAAVLVALLWFGRWVLIKIPKLRAAVGAAVAKEAPASISDDTEQEQPDDDDKE